MTSVWKTSFYQKTFVLAWQPFEQQRDTVGDLFDEVLSRNVILGLCSQLSNDPNRLCVVDCRGR